MPQASDELRDRWKDDGRATEFLLKRGYKLAPDWTWLAPGQPEEDELSAIEYMMDEWDYGWWRLAP